MVFSEFYFKWPQSWGLNAEDMGFLGRLALNSP